MKVGNNKLREEIANLKSKNDVVKRLRDAIAEREKLLAEIKEAEEKKKSIIAGFKE